MCQRMRGLLKRLIGIVHPLYGDISVEVMVENKRE